MFMLREKQLVFVEDTQAEHAPLLSQILQPALQG